MSGTHNSDYPALNLDSRSKFVAAACERKRIGTVIWYSQDGALASWMVFMPLSLPPHLQDAFDEVVPLLAKGRPERSLGAKRGKRSAGALEPPDVH